MLACHVKNCCNFFPDVFFLYFWITEFVCAFLIFPYNEDQRCLPRPVTVAAHTNNSQKTEYYIVQLRAHTHTRTHARARAHLSKNDIVQICSDVCSQTDNYLYGNIMLYNANIKTHASYMLSLRNANAGDFSVSRCLTANEEKCAKIK